MVIALNPDQLRRAAQQMQSASTNLRDLAGRLGPMYAGLEWQVRQRAQLEGQIAGAANAGKALAQQAESLARVLANVAQAFEQVDRQGGQDLTKVANPAVEALRELIRLSPAGTLPVAALRHLLDTGDLLSNYPQLQAAINEANRGGTLQDRAKDWVNGVPLPQLTYHGDAAGQSDQVLIKWPTLSSHIAGDLPRVSLGSLLDQVTGTANAAHGFVDGAADDVQNRLQQALRGIPGLNLLPGVTTELPAGTLRGQVDTAVDSAQSRLQAILGSISPLSVQGAVNLTGGAVLAGTLGGGDTFLKGELLAAHLDAHAQLNADLANGKLSGAADLNAKVQLIDLAAQAKGQIGNDQIGVGGQFSGQANVGAQAQARAELEADIAKGKLGAGGGGEAFIGAQASASGAASAALLGVKAAVNGQATAYAGIGVVAKGNANIDLSSGKISAGIELGAALGIGGKFRVGVDLDVGQAVQNVKDTIVNLVPKIELPHIQLPQIPSIPIPHIELPHIELPHIELPHIELPHIEPPKFKWPPW